MDGGDDGRMNGILIKSTGYYNCRGSKKVALLHCDDVLPLIRVVHNDKYDCDDYICRAKEYDYAIIVEYQNGTPVNIRM